MKIKDSLGKLAYLIIPFSFLIVGIITLKDYGINWDNAQHFNRGQAYLRYIFSGKINYLDLPSLKTYKGSSDFANSISDPEIYKTPPRKGIGDMRLSYFQSDYFNGEYFLNHDSGHPPASDILSALSNFVFYQKLNLVNDTDSYHLYIILICFAGIVAVSYVLYKELGIWASLVGGLSLWFNPLFFAESHFNIKDPVESSYIALTVVFFYLGIKNKKAVFVILSSLFAGLGLGTKFNIAFIFAGLILYLLYLIVKEITSKGKLNIIKTRLMFYLSFLIFPLIVFGIFYGTWPYLWKDFSTRILEITGYYQNIGSGILPELERFVYHGINLYPIVWIISSTPIVLLILSLIGILVSFSRIKDNNGFYFLTIIWFLIPILRVTIGNTSIYGGVRQIMEYIPAMAVLCAVGADFILKKIKNINQKRIIIIGIIYGFVSLGVNLIKIHPYQNLYFNEIIGGLKGAVSYNIPAAVNSFGSAYQQGVDYINKNALPDAKLSLLIGNMVNVARPKLRSDIDFSNTYFSGFAMEGEYLMEIYFDKPYSDWFTYSYAQRTLKPVFESGVDGIAAVKVWKNDSDHSFDKNLILKRIDDVNIEGKENRLIIDLKKVYNLGKIEARFNKTDCRDEIKGLMKVSMENPDKAVLLTEFLEKKQASNTGDFDFYYFFANLPVRYLVLESGIDDSCLFKNPLVSVWEIAEKR